MSTKVLGAGEVTAADIDAQIAVTTPTKTSELYIDEDGTLKKITVEQLQGILSGFHAHRNGVTQVINASTDTKLKFTTEVFDVAGDFAHDADDSGGAAESRYTPSVAGKYLLIAAVKFNSVGDGLINQVRINMNGSEISRMTIHSSGGGAGEAVQVTTTIAIANGTTDYFEVSAFHTHATSRSVAGLATNCYFMGFRIGE